MPEPHGGPPVAIVGLHGGHWYGPGAEQALMAADVVLGSARHLDALDSLGQRGQRTPGPLVELFDVIDDHRRRGRHVCLLASGDPGFFGIAHRLVERIGAGPVTVHPAPSSVALAFARLGLAWDDATVVSCHGRPLTAGLPLLVTAAKAAVLVSPASPPETVGRALLSAGVTDRQAIICSHLGHDGETLARTDLTGLADGVFDPLSVLVLLDPTRLGATAPTRPAVVSWGLPSSHYDHRAGMITKSEVRAVALSKLTLRPGATLWDIGAGSGSIGVEAARLAPGLRVHAVERRADDCARIAANAAGLTLEVTRGEAPDVLAQLPDPDQVVVGGGGPAVVAAAVARIRPGGTIVSTHAVMSAALDAATAIGTSAELAQVQINRGRPIGPDGQLRLAAENPVFVVWGRPS